MTPIARTLATLSVLSVLGVLAGCGQGDSGDAGADSGSDSASGSASDTASDPAAGQDGGPVCPDTLPGSGAATPADASPELPQVESAWVCEYTPTDGGAGGDSGAGSADGPTWQLDGDEVQVPADELPALTESLAGLAPADGDRFCTEEIGPRWLLVTADAEGDTTGVVVDGFGCRDVRLTDDPAATVPGAARQSGDLVGGVLAGPEGLADRLADLHG